MECRINFHPHTSKVKIEKVPGDRSYCNIGNNQGKVSLSLIFKMSVQKFLRVSLYALKCKFYINGLNKILSFFYRISFIGIIITYGNR